jgi:hypothetical protein
VLVLDDSELSLRQARFFGQELKLPVVVGTGTASGGLITSHQLPAALRGIAGGASMVNTDLIAAVRTVLLAALHPNEVPAAEVAVQRTKGRRTADRM